VAPWVLNATAGLLLAVAPAQATPPPVPPGPPITVPAEVKGDVGDFISVPATTAGKEVRWLCPDRGLRVFPADLLKDTKTAVVTAPAAGVFRLYAYTAVDGSPTPAVLCTVTVGPPAPPPPPPPDPNDPFTSALKAAYAAEPDPAKAQQLASLAALYRQAAELAATADLTDFGSLFDTMARAAATLGVAGKLPGIQAVVQAELKRVLPSARSAPLDRALAKATFLKVAAALEASK